MFIFWSSSFLPFSSYFLINLIFRYLPFFQFQATAFFSAILDLSSHTSFHIPFFLSHNRLLFYLISFGTIISLVYPNYPIDLISTQPYHPCSLIYTFLSFWDRPHLYRQSKRLYVVHTVVVVSSMFCLFFPFPSILQVQFSIKKPFQLNLLMKILNAQKTQVMHIQQDIYNFISKKFELSSIHIPQSQTQKPKINLQLRLSYILIATFYPILFKANWRMDERSKNNRAQPAPRKNKYDDWVCLFCQNHNYSFRQICNRCHFQTKQQNNYMNLVYHEQIYIQTEQKTQNFIDQSLTYEKLEVFPNVVFLMLTDDPWEEYPQIWQTPKPLNVKWINNLIQQ